MEVWNAFIVSIASVWNDSGFQALTIGNVIMMLVGCFLLYMAFVKEYEPLLLSPIAFGCILANFPKTGFNDEMNVMMAIGFGIKYEIFPPIIFMGVGAMTDFGPMIADPDTMLLGAAAQFGVFIALAGAMVLGFDIKEAACIGIIGGADGPTSIYLTVKMAPHLLGAIAVAAYSYMSLVPLIQPPVMTLFTTQKEREVRMPQLRPVTKFERIVFPVVCTIVISLLLPPVASLVGMLMLGNLFRESGVTERLSDTAQNSLINIVTIFLATGTGLTMEADSFLNTKTIMIICLGLVAFIGGTFAGVMFGKLMYVATGGKVNPLIGSAGVSAVPMAALERQPDAPPGTYRARLRLADGSALQRTVRIGVTDLVLGEVLEGLDEGDEVLLNVATEASPDASGIVIDPSPGMVMPGV